MRIGANMDNTSDKKALRAEYANRKVVGGIFAVKNTNTGKMLVDTTTDMKGSMNRFEFMKKTGSCYHMKLQKEWTNNPPFAFEILEEIEKSENQTDGEFKTDLSTLKELWLEKLVDCVLY
jgi:hypothetical protein